MRCAQLLLTGILFAVASPGVSGQPKPAGQTPGAPQPQASKASKSSQKAAAPAAKPGPTPSKPGTKAAAKSSTGPAKSVAKAPQAGAKKTAQKKTKPAASTTEAAESVAKNARRDPFESLIGRQQRQAQSLPTVPGKPGLVISTLRLDGVVRTPDVIIAIVTNPQQRTYFLREGDQLFDGRVEKISMDSVSFHEVGKDAFGKPVERQVNKRLYPSPGEQR
jgi:Tfp pilus assembly protein PilP